MARCLNPQLSAGHDNPATVSTCQYCDFLVQGALVGIYEVISFIGAGSYGYVYKVREPKPLNRVLALKVLRKDQFTPKAAANFFQEASRIANMYHPNILPIFNFGEVTGTNHPYFVMEYAPQTIYHLFKQNDGRRRLAYAEELVPYIQQAASALSYVHDQGLVHQDVKPGNLLIGHNNQILLADFGTTYYLGKQTHASLGEITGTAAYMPPEQWQGAPRRDSDQYALAICCYELLAGRLPFSYRGIQDMWQAHVKETPASLQKWNARVPVEVSAVIARAMSKDYRRRYPDINDFAEQYANAIETAQKRYRCYACGQQNRTGAQRCSFCGIEYDRICPHCDTELHFGQRCCTQCGRLGIAPLRIQDSPLIGTHIYQGRYTIKRVLKQSEETRVTSAVAYDEQNKRSLVMLKRWECTDMPIAQRALDIAHYDQVTEPLSRLRHPLLPTVLQRFAEGRYYYVAFSYIDGESIAERLAKLLRPLTEKEVINYGNTVLNVFIALQQHKIALQHYDISPENIIIEQTRGRAILTGFQVPPPPITNASRGRGGRKTTRKLIASPYLPIQDKIFDQRTSIYMLAASMHHALTNVAPPHYPTYPPVRLLNPDISPALESVLSRALIEENTARYQTYEALQTDLQRLLR